MTMAFIRSLVRWQWAITWTCSHGCPLTLITEVDLEKVATDHTVAQEWVAFLEAVAGRIEKLISEAKSRAGGEISLGNVDSVHREVHAARESAEEHVASLAAHSGGPPNAFTRALLQYQKVVMISAYSMSNHCALFPLINLEEAAVKPAIARQWVTELKRMARAHEGIIAEAEDKGLGGHSDVGHLQVILAALRKTKEYVEEHLNSLRYERPRRPAKRTPRAAVQVAQATTSKLTKRT